MAYTPGKGTTLKLSIASVFTSIAQVVNLTPPAMQMGTSETTHLLSSWKTYLATIPDGGEVQLTVEYDASDSTHASLWSNFTAGTIADWQVLFTDAGAALVAFSGCITNFAWDQVSVENVVTASLTIKISGAVVITP